MSDSDEQENDESEANDDAEAVDDGNEEISEGRRRRRQTAMALLDFTFNSVHPQGFTFVIGNERAHNINAVTRELADDPEQWTETMVRIDNVEDFAFFMLDAFTMLGRYPATEVMEKLDRQMASMVDRQKRILTQTRIAAQTSATALQIHVRDRMTSKKSPWRIGKISSANVHSRKALDKSGLQDGYITKDALNRTVYTLSDEESGDEDAEKCENPNCPHEQVATDSSDSSGELLPTYSRKRKFDKKDDQNDGQGGAGAGIAV